MPPRTLRPVYLDRLSPCNHACPAGENVQAWLGEAQAGRYRAAWALILRDNPFPCACTGASATTPARTPAIAARWTTALSIHAIERFIGDLALEQRWSPAHRPLLPGNGSSSSAPDRADCPPPGSWRVAGMRCRSSTRVRSPAG